MATRSQKLFSGCIHGLKLTMPDELSPVTEQMIKQRLVDSFYYPLVSI